MKKRLLLGALAGAVTIAAVPSAANAAATCSYDAAKRTMTVSYGATDQKVVLKNGSTYLFSESESNFRACGGATHANTDRITVRAGANPAAFQNTIIDESAGSFQETNRNLSIVVLTGTGADKLTIRAGGGDDRMNLRSSGGASGPAIDLDGDKADDVFMTVASVVEVDGNGGVDVIDATPVFSYSVFLFGGANDDYLKAGGASGDWLDGGPGNDHLQANLDQKLDVVDGGSSGFDLTLTDFRDVVSNSDGVWQ
jgi:hypothetical protein